MKKLLLLIIIPVLVGFGTLDRLKTIAVKNQTVLTCVDTAVETYTQIPDNSLGIRSDSARQKIAQTLLTTEGGGRCKVMLYLQKVGSPTGNIYVEFYATSGGAPTGSPLATSANVDVSTISTSYTVYTFTWDIEAVSDATTYAVSITGDFAVNASNYVNLGFYNSGAYGDGSMYRYDGSWTGYGGTWDAYFQVKK